MNSTQIKCFLSLGKTHNFSKTAKELFMTQPSVSKNINNLERELNTKLVINKNRTTSLTEAGEYFFSAMKDIDLKVDQIIQKTKSYQSSETKTITIGYTGIPFEQKFLPLLIQKINAQNKWNIKLKRISLSQKDVINNLNNASIDFMLYQSDFFKPSLYGFYPFFESGFSVVLKKDDPLIKFTQVPISELDNRNIYLWDGKSPLKSVARLKTKIIQKLNINENSLHVINSATMAKIIVSSDMGIAVVPSFVYDHDNNDLYYRYLECNEPIIYGIGYLKENKNEGYFKDVISALRSSIEIVRAEWK